MSPWLGSGMSAKPRSGSSREVLDRVLAGAAVVELEPAWWRSRSKVAARMLRTFVSGSASASASSVVIPAAVSRSTWSREMPATSVRWSSSSQRSLQSARKSQSPQWSTGYG